MYKFNNGSTLEEILKERLKQNAEIFTDEEKNIIKNAFNLIKKIYFLGIFDMN